VGHKITGPVFTPRLHKTTNRRADLIIGFVRSEFRTGGLHPRRRPPNRQSNPMQELITALFFGVTRNV
jgi:hypothetical protein